VSRMKLTDLGLAKPRLRSRDLVREAFVSVAGHPARSLITAVGTVLGTAAFVATLGLSSTASHQVSESFDLRRATEVMVRPAGGSDATGEQAATNAEQPPSWQTSEAMSRLRRLNGVQAAGRRLSLPEQPIRRALGTSAGEVQAQVVGVDSDAFDAIEPHVMLGRTFDSFHDRAAIPVVLLPTNVARNLGINRVGVAVFIADRAYTVIGIFDDVVRRPESLVSVLMPFSVTQPLVGAAGEQVKRDIVIKTAAGAAQLISGQATLALAPENPALLQALAPPDPRTLRREIEGSVTRLSLILSIVALAVGTVSIGNAATAGITARIPEIGLRRAVGARRRHIFGQLLAETTMLGALGGLIGAIAGVLMTVTVALLNRWQPVIDIRLAALASAAGALAGLLAGLLPGWRATRIQPVSALQR
jgi:putative ABC transport system permease protein